jgi:hypothetical protein
MFCCAAAMFGAEEECDAQADDDAGYRNTDRGD